MTEATGMTSIEIHPLTPDRWPDLLALFGERGAVGGCWCMWFRASAPEFRRNAGAGNREALRSLVKRGSHSPGLLAYAEGRPAGWCSLGEREEFPRIQRSPILRPIDSRPAWSVVCFYIDRRARGRGIATALLRAAVDYAAAHGARLVEGYPVDTDARASSNDEAYTGTASLFRKAGFRKAARRGGRRMIVRRTIRSEG